MENFTNLNLKLNHHIIKKCNTKWKLDFQKLNYYDLTFVLDGEATYTVNGTEYTLKKGDAIFVAKNNTRMATTNKKNTMTCVAFNFEILDDINLELPTFFKWDFNYKLNVYFKEFNYEWLHENPFYKFKCQSLLSLIIYEVLILKEGIPYNQHITQIQDYIISHLDEKLSVNEISKNFNLHPAYCGTLFKKYANTTILRYIQSMRINQAKNLLMENDLSISEVGEHVGISDLFHFSKVFKAEVGLSPSEFRKTHCASNKFI